jgi:hypothetical protein
MARQANRRTVGPHEDGWQVKASDGDRASAVLKTKAEAIARAREILRNSGGGELTIQDRHGRILDSDTVPPGNDPVPPADRR